MLRKEKLSELFAGSRREMPQFRRITASVKDGRRGGTNEEMETRSRSGRKKRREPSPSTDQDRKKRRRHGRAHSPSTDKERRTVFVGNVPLGTSVKEVRKLFSTCGPVESVRFRSARVAPGKLPVAVARKLQRQLSGTSINCYVVFRNEEGVSRSLCLNGSGMVEVQ